MKNSFGTPESRRKGGLATVKKYGREWMRKIGKRGRKKQTEKK